MFDKNRFPFSEFVSEGSVLQFSKFVTTVVPLVRPFEFSITSPSMPFSSSEVNSVPSPSATSQDGPGVAHELHHLSMRNDDCLVCHKTF